VIWIAKLAYLTSPAPDTFMLNLQIEKGDLVQFEISRAHLANIIIDGASFSLRETSVNHRVPNISTTESAENGHDRRQLPA
jgi:hypothetical protein